MDSDFDLVDYYDWTFWNPILRRNQRNFGIYAIART